VATPIRQVIFDLTIRLTKENPTWGYDRIQGELFKAGHQICDSTVAHSAIGAMLPQSEVTLVATRFKDANLGCW
jgi:hypothetical protein